MPTFRTSRIVRSDRRGFTLVEIMLVVVIAGILLGISGTSIGKQVRRDRVNRSAGDVQGMLQEASTIAVRQRAPVKIILAGDTLRITLRSSGAVLKQRNFGPAFDLNATLAISPSGGVTIFPNGRADAALTVTVSGSNISKSVTRTATGIVRLQ